MPTREKCADCDRYKQEGHNYCRMCGLDLREGYARYARLSLAYYTNEKFCGYCGGPKHECFLQQLVHFQITRRKIKNHVD